MTAASTVVMMVVVMVACLGKKKDACSEVLKVALRALRLVELMV